MQFVKCPILTNNSYPIGIFVGNILLRAARKELRNSLITSLIHFGSTLLNHLLRFYNIDPQTALQKKKTTRFIAQFRRSEKKRFIFSATKVFRQKWVVTKKPSDSLACSTTLWIITVDISRKIKIDCQTRYELGAGVAFEWQHWGQLAPGQVGCQLVHYLCKQRNPE